METKDYTEELILKNQEKLNDNEPPAGHFERFEAKLKKAEQKRKFTSVNMLWKTAVAAALIFLIINQAVVWFSAEKSIKIKNERLEGTLLSSILPEYEEVEFYFTTEINAGIVRWEKMVSQGVIKNDEYQMIKSELDEFQQVFEKLQSDLEFSPSDERVINAVLEFYRTKLSLINMIVEKLEEVKQKTEISYENEI